MFEVILNWRILVARIFLKEYWVYDITLRLIEPLYLRLYVLLMLSQKIPANPYTICDFGSL